MVKKLFRNRFSFVFSFFFLSFVLLGLGYKFLSLANHNPALALFGVSSPSDPLCSPAWGRPDNCYCTPGNSNCLGDCTNSPLGSSTWVCANWPGPACTLQLGETCGVQGSCCQTGQGTCKAVPGYGGYSVCTPICGNHICDSPQESYLNCATDCPAPTPNPCAVTTNKPNTCPCSQAGPSTQCISGYCGGSTTLTCQNPPAPTPTNTPTPTRTPTPTPTSGPTATPTIGMSPTPSLPTTCDPDKTGTSLNKIDSADFTWWVAEFTGTKITKASDCNSDNTIDIFDFNKMRDLRKFYGGW